ncbi:hypothetical protein JTB14_009222 [Gonioctena quinquepunctata]|nr:hypothetical protein JTB14_009222 [Gonioctena quinquepunctata]
MTNQIVMAFLVLSTCFIDNVLNQSIPTQLEQANLLLNVQEVFEQLKLLTKDEADSTDKSVVYDVELMVERAEYILDLLEKITSLRLSCNANSVCMFDARPVIYQLGKDGRHALKACTDQGSAEIAPSSDRLANVTNAALDKGQELFDTMGACSKKLGLQVISCYRNIMNNDVVPVKNTLIGAINVHKEAHFEAIKIRKRAGDCVDDIVKKYRDMMEKVLEEALICK